MGFSSIEMVLIIAQSSSSYTIIAKEGNTKESCLYLYRKKARKLIPQEIIVFTQIHEFQNFPRATPATTTNSIMTTVVVTHAIPLYSTDLSPPFKLFTLHTSTLTAN